MLVTKPVWNLGRAAQCQEPARRDSPMGGDLLVDLEAGGFNIGREGFERNRQLRFALLATDGGLEPRAESVECKRVEERHDNRSTADALELAQCAAACFGFVEV